MTGPRRVDVGGLSAHTAGGAGQLDREREDPFGPVAHGADAWPLLLPAFGGGQDLAMVLPARPARPARWMAEAREMRWTVRRGRPDQGESPATRARPESMTARTPGIVMDDSATLVERMTLRMGPGWTARSCSAGGRSP